MLKQLATGISICISVTHVDGLVLARSAFHHSLNYRSVVLFGTATEVEAIEKERGLFAISEQVLQGRWSEVRPPTAKELGATTVLRINIDEASAKIRTGPPKDEEADLQLPIWAGVIPLKVTHDQPAPDPTMLAQIPVSPSVRQLF